MKIILLACSSYSLLAKFKELKLQSTSEYVFAASSGKLLNQWNINRGHNAIYFNAKIEYVPFHALRHTYATRLLEIGENLKTLQGLFGHADITTTMNKYPHVLDKTKQNTADKIDKILYKKL